MLGDVASLKYGKMPNKDHIKDKGYPIYTGYRIAGYYDEFNCDEKLIVVARGVGGTGDVKISPKKSYLTNISIMVDLDENLARKKYLYYQLTEGLKYLDTGSAQSQITTSDLKRLKIVLPEIDEQDKIVDILSRLDEKIKLNRRMNETLEKIGQALFKHYFIDNPEAKTWSSSGIDRYADCVKKSSKPPFAAGELYIALEHFTQNSLAIYEWALAASASSNKTAFEKGDVLFGKLRPYFHKVAIAPLPGVCSTDILPIRAKSKTFSSYIAHFLNQDSLIDYVTQASEGTRMPRTSWANICNYKINLPPVDLLAEFSKKTSPIHELLLKNIFEMRNLTELRDSLLPRLISGKIKV